MREERGLSDAEIKSLHFGYVPPRVGHEVSGRVIMPLFDAFGELVALTTRDTRPDAEWKHWHESFEKGLHLYGLDIAKRPIISKNKVIVVEGQFDVAYLRSIGFLMTVGILGTALSYSQAYMLSRYCSEVYLFFDGDKGGREATARSMKMYHERGLALHGIMFCPVETPTDKDPDDFDAGEVKTLLVEAKRKVLQANV